MNAMADKSNALLVDDEPEYLEWVEEYLHAQKIGVVFARTIKEAFDAISSQKFAVILVDMQIPQGGVITPEMIRKTPIIQKYPGIALAIRARNLGYGAHQVIGYTVHDDDAADVELMKLNCRYVLKARPGALKSVLLKSLQQRPRIRERK